MEQKHIQNITENEDSVTITFGKSDDDNKEGDRQVPSINSSVVRTEQKDEIKKQEQKETNNISEKENKMKTQKSD